MRQQRKLPCFRFLDVRGGSPTALNDPERTLGRQRQRALARGAFGRHRIIYVLSISPDDAVETPKLCKSSPAASLQVRYRHRVIDGVERVGRGDMAAFEEVESVLLHDH